MQPPPRTAPWVVPSVFVGGCVGGSVRHAIGGANGATLAVNLLGALLLGLLVVAAPHRWRPLLGTGFCGGLTTFGTVTVATADHGEVAYLAGSLLGGVGAAALGVALGHLLSGRSELAPEDPDLEVD
ncbi:MAG TPA: CrcB family protein [Mycobacteriales bacterium]|nr:CrcB family protein [Mycobacteriales bacterium]